MGAIANQFTEVSTPFMNLRQLLYVHHMNESKLARINTILFASTFYIGRLAFQAAFFYKSLPWLLTQWSLLKAYTTYETVGFYFCFGAQILGLVLNLHWSVLIAKGLVRMFAAGKKGAKRD